MFQKIFVASMYILLVDSSSLYWWWGIYSPKITYNLYHMYSLYQLMDEYDRSSSCGWHNGQWAFMIRALDSNVFFGNVEILIWIQCSQKQTSFLFESYPNYCSINSRSRSSIKWPLSRVKSIRIVFNSILVFPSLTLYMSDL